MKSATVSFMITDAGVVAKATALTDVQNHPDSMHDDNFIIFELMDFSHQALIRTLDAICSDWKDFDQTMARLKMNREAG